MILDFISRKIDPSLPYDFFQCFDSKCLQVRGALSQQDRMEVEFCSHITEAQKAFKAKNYAKVKSIKLQDAISKVADEVLEQALTYESSDNEIIVHLLPGGNIAVPLLGSEQRNIMADFVHIRDLKCSLDGCTTKVKSKLHTLVIKGIPVCRHSLLGMLSLIL